MKTKSLIAALMMLAIAPFAWGQEQENMEQRREMRMEKMKSMRVAHITNELELTEAEAQKFWPVYNQMDAELETLREQRREIMRSTRKKEDLSDKEYKAAVNKLMDIETQELAIKKKYANKFFEVIPAKKVFELERAERNFRRQMLSKMRDGGGQGKMERKGRYNRENRPKERRMHNYEKRKN
jgi:Spy/CpxP family protein refolding chaperone